MNPFGPLAQIQNSKHRLLQQDDSDEEDIYPSSPTPAETHLEPTSISPSILQLKPRLPGSPASSARQRSSSLPAAPAESLHDQSQQTSGYGALKFNSASILGLRKHGRDPVFPATPIRRFDTATILGFRHALNTAAPFTPIRHRPRSSSVPSPSTPLIDMTAAEKRLRTLGLAPAKKPHAVPTTEELKAAYKSLSEKDIHFGELATYFFDPVNGLRTRQWEEVFKEKGRATQILNWWVTHNSSSGKEEVREWAIAYVAGLVSKEAEAVNREGLLRSANKEVDPNEIMGFSFHNLYSQLKDKHASISMRIFGALSHSARQIKDGLSKFRLLNKQVVRTFLKLQAPPPANQVWIGHGLCVRILSFGIQQEQ